LVEKFKNYDLFASSDVFEIYGDNELENALHYEAQTFASMYFENKGNGNFEAHPLPVETQLSSINDILVYDFNSDGNLDALLAGNLFAAEVETARNDAGFGTILLGDGKGGFRALSKKESGFFAPLDVKSLLLLERKAGDVMLVGVNNGPIEVFGMTMKPSN
jgi:hypothetical protein